MTTTASSRLLQLALPLVKTHGFTREALSFSVLSLPTPHTQPLPDAAVTSLFGQGDDASRTLIHAWLDDARVQMSSSHSSNMREILKARLKANQPVLPHLPQAFALLASSSKYIPVDPSPILEHAAKVADQACWMAYSDAKEISWYIRRASISAIYAATELHQFTSPETTDEFLESLLDQSSDIEKSAAEVKLFGTYVWKSWAGIIKSSGVL
ncbi:hypothetical protein BJ138DRAFT_613825 [Hygrophoropsis aurantiaca]|uniref:Uncharacterized protein n=1 Tax=Hygrophoropsis aurantiaca TaxID=72124 RepID=A0ACB8ALS5_9AGAM|nr:hypothetical protein BJ138DRAFT_613825 [Hygrophoropsis aurantiaca]